MKVVVAVPLAPPLLAQLAELDLEILPPGPVDPGAMVAAVAGAEGLLVNSHVTVDRQIIDAAPRLRVISTVSVGVDHIDLEAAWDRNIAVTITPVLNDAVADLVMALATMLARRLPEAMQAVADGRWSGLPLGGDLAGKVFLVVGFGRIGQTVAARARAAKMKVIYVDRRPGLPAMAGVDRVDDLATGLREADFVSLHVDLNAATRHLMGQEQFAMMKPTAFLVNTARGAVVDQGALTRALSEGEIAGAALDVLEDEPPRPDEPLLRAANVIVVPHIGSATTETREAMARCAVDNLLMVLRHEGSPAIVSRHDHAASSTTPTSGR